jgi:hypothetical protein
MKLIWWMLSGSFLTALAITFIVAPESRYELWLGMLGPLAAAVLSWIAMARKYRGNPDRLTALMIKAFGTKMIFFAGYITVLVVFGSAEPVPFVCSFAFYFVALHTAEAIGLHRLHALSLSKDPVELQGQLKNG